MAQWPDLIRQNLLMHSCAERERLLAQGAVVARPSWQAAATGLIDAIIGLWHAPVTEVP